MINNKFHMTESIPGNLVLNTYIHALNWDETLNLVNDWIVTGESKYVCLCNVHSVVTAQTDPVFASILEQADLVLPDGMPVAWVLRHKGFKGQPRIGGPDLMWRCCNKLEHNEKSVYLYGSTQETLEKLQATLQRQFPNLHIAGVLSPPFRELSPEEELDIIHKINNSGAHAVFVALGCPRQEAWMLRQRGKLNAVMFGFGAAFDFYAGTIRRAPAWMQHTGFEWLHRLACEPKRLWRRYLVTNTKFILLVLFEIFRK